MVTFRENSPLVEVLNTETVNQSLSSYNKYNDLFFNCLASYVAAAVFTILAANPALVFAVGAASTYFVDKTERPLGISFISAVVIKSAIGPLAAVASVAGITLSVMLTNRGISKTGIGIVSGALATSLTFAGAGILLGGASALLMGALTARSWFCANAHTIEVLQEEGIKPKGLRFVTGGVRGIQDVECSNGLLRTLQRGAQGLQLVSNAVRWIFPNIPQLPSLSGPLMQSYNLVQLEQEDIAEDVYLDDWSIQRLVNKANQSFEGVKLADERCNLAIKALTGLTLALVCTQLLPAIVFGVATVAALAQGQNNMAYGLGVATVLTHALGPLSLAALIPAILICGSSDGTMALGSALTSAAVAVFMVGLTVKLMVIAAAIIGPYAAYAQAQAQSQSKYIHAAESLIQAGEERIVKQGDGRFVAQNLMELDAANINRQLNPSLFSKLRRAVSDVFNINLSAPRAILDIDRPEEFFDSVENLDAEESDEFFDAVDMNIGTILYRDGELATNSIRRLAMFS